MSFYQHLTRNKNKYKEWKVRPDDTYVDTFPKNGTPWTQEFVWLLQNDCSFEGAKLESIERRVPLVKKAILADILTTHASTVMDGFMELKIMTNMPHSKDIQKSPPFSPSIS